MLVLTDVLMKLQTVKVSELEMCMEEPFLQIIASCHLTISSYSIILFTENVQKRHIAVKFWKSHADQGNYTNKCLKSHTANLGSTLYFANVQLLMTSHDGHLITSIWLLVIVCECYCTYIDMK